MSKFRALLVGATAAGAFAAASFIPAHAETVAVPGVGTVTIDGDPAAASGELTADGTVAGTPLDGYVSASGSPAGGDACADDNGAPGDSASPTCLSDVTG